MFRVKDKRRNESRRINFTFSLAPFDSTLTSVSVINLFRPDNYSDFFSKRKGNLFPPWKKRSDSSVRLQEHIVQTWCVMRHVCTARFRISCCIERGLETKV